MSPVWEVFAVAGEGIDVWAGNEPGRSPGAYAALGVFWTVLALGSVAWPLSVGREEGGRSKRGLVILSTATWLVGNVGVDWIYLSSGTYTLRAFALWLLSVVFPVAFGILLVPLTDAIRPVRVWCTDQVKGGLHVLVHRIVPGLRRELSYRMGGWRHETREAIRTAWHRLRGR